MCLPICTHGSQLSCPMLNLILPGALFPLTATTATPSASLTMLCIIPHNFALFPSSGSLVVYVQAAATTLGCTFSDSRTRLVSNMSVLIAPASYPAIAARTLIAGPGACGANLVAGVETSVTLTVMSSVSARLLTSVGNWTIFSVMIGTGKGISPPSDGIRRLRGLRGIDYGNGNYTLWYVVCSPPLSLCDHRTAPTSLRPRYTPWFAQSTSQPFTLFLLDQIVVSCSITVNPSSISPTASLVSGVRDMGYVLACGWC